MIRRVQVADCWKHARWAYVTTRTMPGERMMGQLERISGDFNSQEAANTLWSYATMGRKPGERIMGQLERRAEAMSEKFNSQEVASRSVGVCDNGNKAGGADDGRSGAAGGGDIMIREVQLGGGCKHAVGVCENGDEAGERVMGQLEWRAEAI
jgi:hypothetical protein